MCRFISGHQVRFGVVPICRALIVHGMRIAVRTYYAWAKRAPSKRALWELAITEVIAGFRTRDKLGRKKPESLYGAVKMWAHLNRAGIPVARATVERIMADNGWRGVIRAKHVRTTRVDPRDARAPDLVDWDFEVSAPTVLVVADFTYVPMVSGFGYTAFVIDAFADMITGWDCSTSRETAFVERALRQASTARAWEGNLLSGNTIHHSDAGSPGGFNRWSQHLVIMGVSDGSSSACIRSGGAVAAEVSGASVVSA
jgi:putative transposase